MKQRHKNTYPKYSYCRGAVDISIRTAITSTSNCRNVLQLWAEGRTNRIIAIAKTSRHFTQHRPEKGKTICFCFLETTMRVIFQYIRTMCFRVSRRILFKSVCTRKTQYACVYSSYIVHLIYILVTTFFLLKTTFYGFVHV